MVWGLAAALAAGILQNVLLMVAAIGAIVFFARPFKLLFLQTVLFLGLAAVLYAYGYHSVASVANHVRHFDGMSRSASQPVWLTGWVSSYPQPGYGGARFGFVTTIDSVRHCLWIRTSEFVIDYGDSLRMQVDFRRSRRARDPGHHYWVSRGMCGSGKALPGTVERLPGRAGSLLRRECFWRAHQKVRCDIERRLGARAGVPMALVLGERGALDRKVRDGFVTLGLAHLLALSGFHLGFVAGSLILLMRLARIRRRGAVVVALAGYVALVGVILSLYRALVMVVLLILASTVHRPVRPLTALANAFLVMLLIYPQALFSVGFQLSFVATFAVLLAIRGLPDPPRRGRGHKLLYWIRCTVQVGAVVQIVLAPMLLFYFGKLSVAAPLTTVVFVGPVMVLLALTAAAVLLGLVSSPVSIWTYWVLERVTVAFEWLLDLFVRITPEPIELAVPNAYLFYAGVAMLWFPRKAVSIKVMGFFLLCSAWLPFLR